MFGNDWDEILKEEVNKPYFLELKEKVREEYKNNTIFPEAKNLFNAFKMTPYHNLKVVILGQDPYHGTGEANGMCFSVNKDIKIPPSLKNIYKELTNDLDIICPNHGDLTCWSKSGVLLLNSVLTVKKNQAASHKNLGWETFTDAVISKISEKDEPVVFILWGNFARSKKTLIDEDKHYIIESPHPSPFSANNGFFGSKPFSKTNEYLGKRAINWEIK